MKKNSPETDPGIIELQHSTSDQRDLEVAIAERTFGGGIFSSFLGRFGSAYGGSFLGAADFGDGQPVRPGILDPPDPDDL